MNEEKRKKLYSVTGIIASALIFILYLYALFLPGIWHGDAFLYLKKDGSFEGSDMYAEYKMTVSRKEYEADITFSVNDKTKLYNVRFTDTRPVSEVEISEEGKSVFKGEVHISGEGFILLDEELRMADGITVRTDSYVPCEEELFPGYTKLYRIAVSDKTETRGSTYMLILVFMFSLMLFLDIKFPKLFWLLQHGIHVDGGEPSDWYISGQKFGRILMGAGIIICMVLSFTMV